MWLPLVMTSTPAARIASAVEGVRPIPPATFSPLAVTKSMPRSSRSSGRRFSTATRPGLPMRSPIMRTRQAPGGRGRLPLAGLPRRVRPVVGPEVDSMSGVCGIWPDDGLLEGQRAPVALVERQHVTRDRIAVGLPEAHDVLVGERAWRAGHHRHRTWRD